MTRLLSDKIETIDPGFGIEIMTLTATVAEPLAPKQAVFNLVEEPEPDVSGLIDLLANRVDEQNLYRMAPVASDVRYATSRRWRRRPARSGPAIGRGHRGCLPIRSRSTLPRCCRTIRPRPSPGAAGAGG
jgi:hypothetical protein